MHGASVTGAYRMTPCRAFLDTEFTCLNRYTCKFIRLNSGSIRWRSSVRRLIGIGRCWYSWQTLAGYQ